MAINKAKANLENGLKTETYSPAANGKCFDEEPYCVFIKKSESEVALFSKLRVPFDMPKKNVETIKSLKADIIQAVNGMTASTGCLTARYGTTEKSFYDVENVLFYNIGTTNFNSLAREGVAFSAVSVHETAALREEYGVPPAYSHYYEYKIGEQAKTEDSENLLAKWQNIALPCAGLTASKVWKTIREARDKISVFDEIDTDKGDTFSIVLDITKPRGLRFSVMTAMKPLLDGLICALHDGAFNNDEVDYFCKTIGCDSALFEKRNIEVLGYRQSKVVRQYRNNIKWNPADDLCDRVIISIKDGDEWNVCGKIYSAPRCPNCGGNKLAKLLWGMPTMNDELREALKSKKVKLAGCVIDENAPRFYCNSCKKRF